MLTDALERMRKLRERDAPAAEQGAPEPVGETESPNRRITVYARGDLSAQAHSAVLELGAEGKETASISALLDVALEREMKRLSKMHRDGVPWPEHKGRLPGDRPPLS